MTLKERKAIKTKNARKEIMLKAIADKKDRETKITFSIAVEKPVKEALDFASNEYGISASFLINELLKRELMVDV